MPMWKTCSIHGPGDESSWGCPGCVDDMRSLLADLADSPVEFDDDRIKWITVQIDRPEWARLQAYKRK